MTSVLGKKTSAMVQRLGKVKPALHRILALVAFAIFATPASAADPFEFALEEGCLANLPTLENVQATFAKAGFSSHVGAISGAYEFTSGLVHVLTMEAGKNGGAEWTGDGYHRA